MLILHHTSPRTSYQPHCTVFSFSVTDDLVLVHCKRDMTTAVFDIAGAGQDVDAHGTPAYLEGSGNTVTQWGCNVPTGIASEMKILASKDTTKKKNERFKITELFLWHHLLPWQGRVTSQ